MPEAQKNTNEIAIRRKRIFNLLKKFHPDVFSGSGYENEASELTKVITAILDLEIGETMPEEFRDKSLTIVFVDENDRPLRSKYPLLIATSQEKFLSDLEYIIAHKRLPVNEKVTSQHTTSQDYSSSYPKSEEKSSYKTQEEESSRNLHESRIKAISELTEAKELLEYFKTVNRQGVLRGVDFIHLEDAIKAKVNKLMELKFSQTAINTPNAAKELLEYFKTVNRQGVLRGVDFIHLEDAIKAKVKISVNFI